MNIKDLKTIELVRNADFKHTKWQQNWFHLPWRNYGYLRFETKYQTDFSITSMMFDVKKPILEPTKLSYELFPVPPKKLEIQIQERKNLIIRKKKHRRKKIDYFKQKFSNLSQGKLIEKVNDSELVNEARVASKELLNEKNTFANSGYNSAGLNS